MEIIIIDGVKYEMSSYEMVMKCKSSDRLVG